MRDYWKLRVVGPDLLGAKEKVEQKLDRRPGI